MLHWYERRSVAFPAVIALRKRLGPGDADLLARLRERLDGRRLVFCLTNGRSGSNRLADLLGALEDATVLHEPPPAMHPFRRRAACDPRFARDFLLRLKLPAIARSPGRAYVETSHLFGKGYAEPMLRTGIPFSCIFLRRDARKVALSCAALNDRPGTPGQSLDFFIAPDEAECLPIAAHADRLSTYQLFYWHVLEVERRAVRDRDAVLAAGGRFVEAWVDRLNDMEAIRALVADLGLGDLSLDEARLSTTLPRRSNEKTAKKRPLDLSPDELDRQEREVRALLGIDDG